MFGMKRRAKEREEKRSAEWKEEWERYNYDLPLKPYDIDGVIILASRHEIKDGCLTLYTGRSRGFPGVVAGMFSLPSFRTEDLNPIRVWSRGEWKAVVIDGE